MFKIREELEVLFENEKNKKEYRAFDEALKRIENEARSAVANNTDAKDWKTYMALKEDQYSYLKVLSEYIPKLLAKKTFFKSVFKVK